MLWHIYEFLIQLGTPPLCGLVAITKKTTVSTKSEALHLANHLILIKHTDAHIPYYPLPQ